MYDGTSSYFTGNVSFNFPDGFIFPVIISSNAPAPACPDKYPCKSPLQLTSQGVSIAEPALNTPTMFLFTLLNSSSNLIWFAGIFICCLSNPSDSLNSSNPKK